MHACMYVCIFHLFPLTGIAQFRRFLQVWENDVDKASISGIGLTNFNNAPVYWIHYKPVPSSLLRRGFECGAIRLGTNNWSTCKGNLPGVTGLEGWIEREVGVVTYFIANPPSRVWHRNEGLLLLHSFLSLDILVAFSILRLGTSAKSVSWVGWRSLTGLGAPRRCSGMRKTCPSQLNLLFRASSLRL